MVRSGQAWFVLVWQLWCGLYVQVGLGLVGQLWFGVFGLGLVRQLR